MKWLRWKETDDPPGRHTWKLGDPNTQQTPWRIGFAQRFWLSNDRHPFPRLNMTALPAKTWHHGIYRIQLITERPDNVASVQILQLIHMKIMCLSYPQNNTRAPTKSGQITDSKRDLCRRHVN